MVNWLMNGLVEWLTGRVMDLLGGLLAFLTSAMFLSPDVTVLPQVTTIAGKSSLVVNATFILAIIAVGIATMVGGSVEMRYSIKDLLPRLVVGFVASNFAVPLCSALIDIANSLTVSMVGTAAPTTEAVQLTRTHVQAALTDQNTGLLALIIGILIVGLFLTMFTGVIVRIGLLVILAGIAPVALACYCTPWTQGAAQLWWRSLLGCLGTATLQAIAFSTGVQLFLDPKSNLPVLLGLPNSDVVNLFLVVVLLWVTVKIPGLMRRYVTKSSPSQAGTVLRVVLIQQLTRGLSRAASGARGTTRIGRGAGGSSGTTSGGGAPWPVTSPGGGHRPLPRATNLPSGPRTPRTPVPARVPSRPPAGAGPGVVGVAYPTGRPIKPYTADELAQGVDPYTRSLKARRAAGTTGRTQP